jgi:hypothetical protein
VEPLRPLTLSQRRELDAEAELVASVMEAAASLAIGKVTVGAHA